LQFLAGDCESQVTTPAIISFSFITDKGGIATMLEGLFQPTHLLVIFGIALLVLGPKKLPELGKGIGEGIRGFKSAMKAEEEKPADTKTISAAVKQD
jgi:sec-independent protein translocase protein TatA